MMVRRWKRPPTPDKEVTNLLILFPFISPSFSFCIWRGGGGEPSSQARPRPTERSEVEVTFLTEAFQHQPNGARKDTLFQVVDEQILDKEKSNIGRGPPLPLFPLTRTSFSSTGLIVHICHNHHNRWLCKKNKSSVKKFQWVRGSVVLHTDCNFTHRV